MSIRGYTFFLGCFYIMVVLLAFVCGLCVWVGRAFRSNTFTHVWPIQVRWGGDGSNGAPSWLSPHAA